MDSRAGSRDRSDSRMVKHQHSFSENGKIAIPMWDSSDPDRAPPPLPLNPGASGNSPITKSFASSNIEKAAALIASRALENAPSTYTINPLPSASPERNATKPHHRRMQTIQTGSVSRISDSLERRSPEKGLSRSRLPDFDDFRPGRSPERSPIRSESPTPLSKSASTPADKPKFDENTPLSSNMLALQSIRNRQEAESPLADVTNGTPTLRSSMSLESLSTQILNITSIATNLQREMANLSRRSKDNATDLSSLREATNVRDEDIRKSLKDLVSSLDNKFSSIDSRMLGVPEASRSTPNLGLYLDDTQQTPTRKTINLGRVASPASFLEREITASPSVVSVDGAASIALLEKVLREMATKDGQEKVAATLEDVKAYANTKATRSGSQTAQPAIDPEMMRKLEEILIYMREMREDSTSKALVRSTISDLGRSPSQMDIYLDKSGQITKVRSDEERRTSGVTGLGTELLSDDILKLLKSVKQSLSHNGGLTNEVKALIRELRGEVLGMGREIAKKLGEADDAAKSNGNKETAVKADDVARIVDQGLLELKEHMHHIVRENRRKSSESTRSVVDTQEVINAVHKAMREMPQPTQEPSRDVAAEREEMISAVKEAWEECKPEIALEHFGLERDEILETLKEGLQTYQSQQSPESGDVGVTYNQVVEAVQRGLEDFRLPQIQTQAGATREEILATIKECLDDYDFPMSVAPSQLTNSELNRDEIMDAVKEVLTLSISQPKGADLNKDDIMEAVRDGMASHSHVTKEIEFDREDLFDAIKACLEGEQNPLGGMGERVVEAMHEFLGSMKTEFQQYSAANGRDTEQVLDALKDGLEGLRSEIETYVDRAADVTGKDEIIDIVRRGFAAMQSDMDKGFASRIQSAPNTPELLDAMEKEFEHLRESISKSMSRANMSSDKEEILDAIRDITDDRQSSVSGNSDDVLRMVKEELEHMRTTLASTLIKSGSALERDDVLDAIREGLDNTRPMPRADGNESVLSNTSELLDAFQDGVDGIRADMKQLMDKSADSGAAFEILDTLKEGIETIRADIHRMGDRSSDGSDTATAQGREMMLHEGSNISSEIESLKVMITQLRIKVEALDNMPIPEPIIPSEIHVHKEDLADLHAAIREIHDSVNMMPREMPFPEVVMPEGAALKEDTYAIETLLRNVKAQLDDLSTPDLEPVAKTTHLLCVEDMLREIKATIAENGKTEIEAGNSEDFTLIQLLLKDVQSKIEELPTRIGGSSEDDGKLSKTDLEVLETICLETKEKLDAFSLPEIDNIASKDDMLEVKDSLRAFRDQLEADNDLTAQAFEARKIEHGGLATKIDDVKALMADVREEFMSKLNGSEEGIVELAKVLGMHHDNMNTYATAVGLAELSDLVQQNFTSHMEHHASSKSEMEVRDATLFDKHEETTSELKAKIEERFNDLMTKYDDAQLASEAKLSAWEERDKSHLEAATDVKTVVENLKGLMDTLGSTVSETCERLSTDSKTVFEKVDDANSKLDDLNVSSAHDHSMTREELSKVLDTAIRVEGSLQEHQPSILAAIQEVLGIVGQHYEHSQQQSEHLRTATDEIKTGVNAIPSAIPPLLPALDAPRSPSLVQQPTATKEYDDTETQIKLDDLLSHTSSTREFLETLDHRTRAAEDSFGKLDKLEQLGRLDQLDKLDQVDRLEALEKLHQLDQLGQLDQLDKLVGLESLEKLQCLDALDKLSGLDKLEAIQQQVRDTADEITAMVTMQTRLITEDQQSKVDEAKEAAVALEQRVAQKGRVEAEIIALTQEKNALAESMASLRREHESLILQTKHLSREVGKLETALSIRQEEMRDMNVRAETLERRVLEGVMNHARSMKFGKTGSKKKKISPAERDASMNLKRVPSTSSNSTTRGSAVRSNGSALSGAVGMALKKRAPLVAAVAITSSSPRSPVDRRILSSSHVTGNRVSDAQRALVLAPVSTSGLVSLKRSHSVKSNPSSYVSGRKPSWNGTESFVTDKENRDRDYDDHDDDASDSGTERRTSYTGTYTDSVDYGTGSSVSRNSMRSASYASSIGGTLNGQQDSILEEEEEEDMTGDDQAVALADVSFNGDDSGANTQLVTMEASDELRDLPHHEHYHHHRAKYSVPSDSGIGTEPLSSVGGRP